MWVSIVPPCVDESPNHIEIYFEPIELFAKKLAPFERLHSHRLTLQYL